MTTKTLGYDTTVNGPWTATDSHKLDQKLIMLVKAIIHNVHNDTKSTVLLIWMTEISLNIWLN